MLCEFEEKNFEQPLNIELSAKKNLIYSPGPVAERILGFDSALYTQNWHLLKLFAPRSILRRFLFWLIQAYPGVQVSKEFWEVVSITLNQLPPFRFNLFIQHKRPEYLSTKKSAQWTSWQKPYFRYKITPHQQDALCKLENAVKARALILYASPAFHTKDQLWSAMEDNNLVSKTNFTRPSKLVGHHLYTYTDSGTKGIAFSEPEDIEIPDIDVLFDSLRTGEDGRDQSNNAQFVIELGESVDNSFQELSPGRPSYQEIVASQVEGLLEIPLAVAFIRVAVFRFLTRTTWLVGI